MEPHDMQEQSRGLGGLGAGTNERLDIEQTNTGETGNPTNNREGDIFQDDFDVSKTNHSSEMRDERLPSKVYERLIKCRCCAFCIKRFPRTCAVWVGVIVPLWILIIFSLVFGAAMCEFEAPPEIMLNNQKLAQSYFAAAYAAAVTNLTMTIPRICFVLFLEEAKNLTSPADLLLKSANVSETIQQILQALQSSSGPLYLEPLLVPFEGDEFPSNAPDLFDQGNMTTINATQFFYFMSDCGESGQAVIEKLMDRAIENAIDASAQLTFNWIRCFTGARGGQRSYDGSGLTAQERSIAGQSQVFGDAWNQSRHELFEEYYERLIDLGIDPLPARANASLDAVNHATGGSVCELNAPAAAWFWFTVQTTVGYGNAPPTTNQSYTMVYTVGFLAILSFGGILATAGYILSFLFDLYANKYGFAFLAKPWVGCIIWGSVYYSWMIVIAKTTISWKKDRLGEEFSMHDSYWFSYISTTSVGLGDFYLENEGIIGSDLVMFPMLFLVGFMYVTAFLNKLLELVLSMVQRGRKSFIETLLDKHVNWDETFTAEEPS